MKRKDLISQPWSWVDEGRDLTQESLESSYRVNLKQHASCRKNCKANPRCLTGFGEASWTQPLEEDYLELQRANGTFVGLKNLGNTCYINCFLQLWFHNKPLREALYQWDALQDPTELEKHFDGLLGEDNYEPLSSVAHLQVLFAEMEFGLEKYCDPDKFCKSLSIDVELQQDAQEFGKLYMTCLENTFSNARNEFTRSVIKAQFRGQYSYATTCSQCLNVSRRQSDFYELELNIKKTILDSLAEFIQVDNLRGDDKYFCEICNEKQDATRCIELNNLPQVLQLQLVRYYFDTSSATKKKVNQNIAFPDELDMSQFMGKAENSEMYSLQAVLMHGGTSANSGHYYAHINTEDGWHVFDDISVKKQKKLALINDEPLTKNGEKKSPKIKGFRSSSAAYMLVYRKQNIAEKTQGTASIRVKAEEIKPEPDDNKHSDNDETDKNDSQLTGSSTLADPDFPTYAAISEQEKKLKFESLPRYLQKTVEKRNEVFLHSCQIQFNEYEEKLDHQNFVDAFFNIITPEKQEEAEFIHTDAITNLKNFERLPLDNKPLLCIHGGLNVHKYKDYKLISSKAVDLYVDRFGGGPRIPFSQLCKNCVLKHAAEIRAQNALKADVKLASQLQKSLVTTNMPGFWVGKKSLKNWWTQINPHVDVAPEEVTEEVSRCEMGEFNSDITCPHGGLLHAETGRRLIVQNCWEIFKKYFPKSKEFPKETEPCCLCKNDAQATQENQRLQARKESDLLQSLIEERRELTGDVFYLVSLVFVTAWRRYVRSAKLQVFRERPASSSVFQSLLCPAHNLLICDPSADSDRIFTLSPEEWLTLKQLYNLTNEIRVEKAEDGSCTYNMGLCNNCIADLECQEDSYFGAKMYVYKVTNEVDEESLAQIEAAETEVKKSGQKRKQSNQPFNNVPLKKAAVDCIRRSARSRVSKEEKISFRINKHTTLKELKIMICNKLCVLPCDQHLSLDGNDLDDLKTAMGLKDEEATFIKLRVPPSSTLRLLADEPSPDLEALTECGPMQPEPGFKGTGLGGC